MTATPPCGCGKPAAAPRAHEASSMWGASRASRRERGASFATSGFVGSNERWREGKQRRLAAGAGAARGTGDGEASHDDHENEGVREGLDSSSRGGRRVATSRSRARKRARGSATGRGGGTTTQRPPGLFFPLLPVGRQGPSVSARARKSVFGAWFSRGKLAAAIAAAVLAVASAQEDGGESSADTADSVTVSLASAGLQYTADVVITNSSAVS